MLAQTKLISDYIDGCLSDKKSAEFLLQIQKNKSLKNEFVLIKDLNSFMKGKLFSETVETDPNFSLAETKAKEDVSTFLQEGKTNNEILKYLSSTSHLSHMKHWEKDADAALRLAGAVENDHGGKL